MVTGPKRIIATFSPSPGRELDVLRILRDVEAGTRQEPANEQYDLYASEVDGTVRFHIVEAYTDTAAVEAHRASEHYRRYRARIADLLDAPIDVAVLQDPEEVVEDR